MSHITSQTESRTVRNASAAAEQWQTICAADAVKSCIGVRARIGHRQVAIFRVAGSLYALDAVDPFSRAAVLSRGLVGDLDKQLVVASPVYKQHFNLATGTCLEDESVRVDTFPIRELEGQIQILPQPQEQQAALAEAG